MEENQNTTSPLASFPNEHTVTPSPIKPFYKSRLLLMSLILLILLGIVTFSSIQLLGTSKEKKELVLRKPTQAPKTLTADWNTYTNTSYAYELKYDKNTEPKQIDNTSFNYTDFLHGCMKVYALPSTLVATTPEEKIGIPWKQLNDLKTLPVGQSRNCSTLMFTFGADGKAVINRNDYKRLESEKIGGSEWYAFTVKNPESTAVTTHNVYFTEKNNNTYVIETKTGGSCPTAPKDMLATFSFTK